MDFIQHRKHMLMIGLFIIMFNLAGSVIAYAGENPGEEIVKYTTDSVHLREGPSTDNEILDTLPQGTLVDLKEDSEELDGWSLVVYHAEKGYIKSDYLDWEKPPEPEPVPAIELLEWSRVKSMFTLGVAVKVQDVWSGITYYIKSFSNGMHADVEPVTKEDTAKLKQTYGNSWSWDARPVWVTINGHIIAAAINGKPHGGGVNSGNGMNGQVCLHFKGSSVHNGNRSYQRTMQSAVQQAWNARP